MTAISDQPFVVSRAFGAPRARVWQAWTEVEQLEQWWGPKGFVVTHCKLDLRPGGLMHYCLRSPDGNDMWGRFVYREIVKPERLVWVNSFSDEKGGITRHPMAPGWPREMLTTVRFAEQGKGTLVTVQWVPINATEVERRMFDEGRASMQQGWTGTFEQFEQYLGR
jgi:uncharacterized protein YndB with AHSA1/START domain